MRLFLLLAVLAATTVMATAAGPADAVVLEPLSERNFAALLLPVAGGPANGLGFLLFRQPRDAEQVVVLDLVVANLAPNHSYYLQRATDSTVDDRCTGTNWLTLGQGPVPEAITTGRTGSGGARLFRDLTAVPAGTRFDIHFRVVDAATSAAVLVSSCDQFTVSP